jgi:hypothetical protein
VILTEQLAGQELGLEWGWVRAGFPAAGEHILGGELPIRTARLVLEAPDVVLVTQQAGVEAHAETGVHSFEAFDLVPVPTDGGQAMPDATVAWRIAAVGERQALTDRAALLDEVAHAAVDASMPEPALPVSLKNRQDGQDLVAEVTKLVRRQTVTATQPGQGALVPRGLMKVRRSGWATPWEKALLLTRYLRQLKVEAEPLPIRPATRGLLDPASPVGFTEAVVRIPSEGGDVYIDPSCGMCAVGEIRPELWGGAVLHAELEILPPGPTPRRQRTATLRPGPDGVVGEISELREGPLAVATRQAMLSLPQAARRDALEAGSGLSGATLAERTGLAERGGSLTLSWTGHQAEGPWLPSDLPVISADGSAQVRLPWHGQREDIVRLEGVQLAEGIDALQVGSMSWFRSIQVVGEDTELLDHLDISQPLVDRADAERFFREVAAHRRALNGS